jgi:Do/DeqQ family serine protease
MKWNKANLMYLMAGALIGLTIVAFSYHPEEREKTTIADRTRTDPVFQQTRYTPAVPDNLPDLTRAAEESIHAVVHIRTTYQRKPSIYDYFYDFRDFFEDHNFQRHPAPAIATGSGVIISDDGYIVTNNHVVESADNIEVTLNDKRTYKARLVGTDPGTDLALIKIEEKNLPYLIYGNSDDLKIGEWVLAVGNPFNLTSTVTAGIVSAKARDINILGPAAGESAIESFIQTDAAVNKGNSGGALVNTRGELVGINAAIASGTGYYAGYSFAIPVNIVKKVVIDLQQYGQVQRGYIGVTIRDLNAKFAEEKGIDDIEGVYVMDVSPGGSAEDAGIRGGDVILSINNQKVNSTSELMGLVGQYRPGDKVNVEVRRDNKIKNYRLVLTDRDGQTELKKKPATKVLTRLGAEFEVADGKTLKKLGLDNGVRIVRIEPNGLLADRGIEPGFIITRIDNKQVFKVDDIEEILSHKSGGVLIEGVYPNGVRAYYGFGL